MGFLQPVGTVTNRENVSIVCTPQQVLAMSGRMNQEEKKKDTLIGQRS